MNHPKPLIYARFGVYAISNREYGHLFGRKLKTSSKSQAQCKIRRHKPKLDPLSCTFTLVVIVEN